MSIVQVKGVKGKGKNGKGKKGKGKDKDKKDNGEAKGSAQTDESYFVGECGCCGKWARKKARKQKKNQGGKPLAAMVQAVETASLIQSDGRGRSSGRNARILVDSGADEHVCTTDFHQLFL